ncbi:hypothetical protein CDL12_15235 [Handroanthus impetiginosus]|uniref:TF-B3 domain-containing protein n=1 Tax=Handroanthus impetiginosus TaxID=429701 RepID=A0A2G9H3S2_9LAMI|nr:hypothetical protein CDL12_15235 [Handroanthus impetiginosus]
MSGLDGDGGIGCSANNGRWECLIYLAKVLSEGKIVLEPFANGVEKPCYAPFNSLVLGFKNKGKRSPRNKKVVFFQSESLERTGGKKRLKIIFNRNLQKTHDVITIKNPMSKDPEKNPPKTRRNNEKIETNDVENIVPDVIFNQDSDSKKPSSKNCRKRRMNCKEEEGVSKKRAKKTSDVMDPAPDLPQAFKSHILDRGCDLESVVLVTQKELTGTDVSTGHCKLSVRYNQVRNNFLKPSEVGELDKEKGRVEAILFQPCSEECKISLRNWKSNSEYALVHNWKEVCSRNGLKEGIQIQLWSFRRNNGLCFALVRLS